MDLDPDDETISPSVVNNCPRVPSTIARSSRDLPTIRRKVLQLLNQTVDNRSENEIQGNQWLRFPLSRYCPHFPTHIQKKEREGRCGRSCLEFRGTLVLRSIVIGNLGDANGDLYSPPVTSPDKSINTSPSLVSFSAKRNTRGNGDSEK